MTRLSKFSLADAYAIIAVLFGGFFLIATPPFGTGDETAHYERAFEVSQGAFLGADGLPAGMQALIDDAFTLVKSGVPADADDFRRWSAIDLEADGVAPWPEPIRAVMRLHSPVCYLHFAPVVAAGVAFDLPPATIFWLGRIVALLLGVFLVRAALRRAPSALRPPMVFMALLPTTIVHFGAFNIESLLVGLAFYYFALVASLAAAPSEKLTTRDVAALVGIALLLGQFKTGYLLLPAFALILPGSKFSGAGARVALMAAVILPGAVASLGWAMAVKTAILGDIVYSTFDGNHVEPSAQLAQVLSDPLAYAGVVFRTIFASDALNFAWMSLLALGGWTNVPVPAAIYALLTVALFFVVLSGEKPPPAMTTGFAIATQLLLFLATIGAILTLVYLQWNGVGAPVIEGFQGRYLIAAAPLLFALAPIRISFLAAPERRAAVALAAPVAGLLAMSAAILARYW